MLAPVSPSSTLRRPTARWSSAARSARSSGNWRSQTGCGVGGALDLFAALAPRRVDWRARLAAEGLDALAGRAYGSLSGWSAAPSLIGGALVNGPRVASSTR
jgi:hypothetical protein